VFEVSTEQFEEFVADALDSIPEEFASRIENVAFLVEDDAEDANLFGLYQGTPLTKRYRVSGSMPDRITIFQGAICRACSSEQQVRELVRETVIHELGHYFGMGDEKLRALGW
jgi:predicted Zn-dependent protease with MMP-like domain